MRWLSKTISFNGLSFFDKKPTLLNKSSRSGVANEPNYQLANELHTQITKKFKKTNVYSSFGDNVWGVNLADMQSLRKYNKRIKYLLCALDILSKYAWAVSLKNKKGSSIVNAFQKVIPEGRKPNKIWVYQGSKFYSNLFNRFLKINNIDMYSKYN